MKHLPRNGTSTYLVKWKGYSYEESTWEPSTNFKKQTLEKYHRERKERKANESGSSSDDDETLATLIEGVLDSYANTVTTPHLEECYQYGHHTSP